MKRITIVLVSVFAFMACNFMSITPRNIEDKNENEVLFRAVEIDEKWGFIDDTGEIVITPSYREVSEFNEGLAAVQVQMETGAAEQSNQEVRLWGYINKNRTMVIQPTFLQADIFSEGLALVMDQDNKMGFIDKKGNYIYNPEKTYYAFGLYPGFKDGLAPWISGNWMLEGTRILYIDQRGEIAFDLTAKLVEQRISEGKIEEIPIFSEGLAQMVLEDGRCFYINKTGKITITFDHGFGCTSDGNFYDGMALIRADNYGYINNHGDLVIEPIFSQAYSFSEGLASAQFPGGDYKYGYIDTRGRVKIKPQFDDAEPFSEGLAAIKLGDKWGFIDKNGNIIISPRYDRVEWVEEISHSDNHIIGGFFHGLAEVVVEDNHFFIDSKGNIVYELEN